MDVLIPDKSLCFGCEACVQACTHNAIKMEEDNEGFRYPVIDPSPCVKCGLCEFVCPSYHMPTKNQEKQYVFGGYNKDTKARFESTSGGAFSAIVDAFCDKNYVVFGAKAIGIIVSHTYVEDKNELSSFRKSKYSQSIIGSSFKQVKTFLKAGKKVLFSGTPCQIAGLRSFLNNVDQEKLLTVEVICEGVPSPLYVRKWDEYLKEHCGGGIESIDYRYKGKALFQKGKWDFQQLKIVLKGKDRIILKDRWFNPFWSIWLDHLMSRPSCYKCRFTTSDRVSDISLGDLWGVHLFCPDLYGGNGGSSLVVCNTEKGKAVFSKARELMYGRELTLEDALKYQSPMRKSIAENPSRGLFIEDLQSDMSFRDLNKKWAVKPTVQLLWKKYVWGNRQRVFFWSIMSRLKTKHT